MKCRMGWIVPAALLVWSSCSEARLGGKPSLTPEETPSVLTSQVSASKPYYDMLGTVLPGGTRVYEYIGLDGHVFAVSWSGPVRPNLEQLLGDYFEAMISDVDRSNVVIQSGGGYMNAYQGRAWLPEQLPTGFLPSDIR